MSPPRSDTASVFLTPGVVVYQRTCVSPHVAANEGPDLTELCLFGTPTPGLEVDHLPESHRRSRWVRDPPWPSRRLFLRPALTDRTRTEFRPYVTPATI